MEQSEEYLLIRKAILAIQYDVIELMERVLKFRGTKEQKEYIFLEEMLIKNLIKLDNLEPKHYDDIKRVRRDGIQHINRCSALMEQRAEYVSANMKTAEKNKKIDNNIPTTSEPRDQSAKAQSVNLRPQIKDQMNVQHTSAAVYTPTGPDNIQTTDNLQPVNESSNNRIQEKTETEVETKKNKMKDEDDSRDISNIISTSEKKIGRDDASPPKGTVVEGGTPSRSNGDEIVDKTLQEESKTEETNSANGATPPSSEYSNDNMPSQSYKNEDNEMIGSDSNLPQQAFDSEIQENKSETNPLNVPLPDDIDAEHVINRQESMQPTQI